jgi:hypothetical protein
VTLDCAWIATILLLLFKRERVVALRLNLLKLELNKNKEEFE